VVPELVIVALGMTLGRARRLDHGGLRAGPARVPVQDAAITVLCLVGLMVPEQAVFIPLYTMFADLRLAQQLPRADPAAHGGAHRRVPDDAVLQGDPQGHRGGRAARRRRLAADLLVHHAAAGPARDDDAGDPDVPLRLERLSLAARLGAAAERFTITLGLASIQSNFAQSEGLGRVMASGVIASLPVVILFLIFQRYVVQAMTAGGTKG
jgi:multiple sugar transport system permease protein